MSDREKERKKERKKEEICLLYQVPLCLQVTEGEPAVVWLSGLHIPESFLTALVQATCRRNGWPLDKSTLYTAVTQFRTPEQITERAHSGEGQAASIESV